MPRAHEETSARPLAAKAFLAALLLAVALTLLPTQERSAQAARPAASQPGRLDLTAWDPAGRGLVELRGTWEFYAWRLVTPQELHADPPSPSGYIAVPGSWSGFATEDGPFPDDAYATYRLLVDLPPASAGERLALYIPYEQTAYRLWIDGRPAAENGLVGPSPEHFSPQYLPAIARFEAPAGPLEIVVQVANFAHRVGGMWNSPLLGTEEALDRRLAVRLLSTALLAGAFLFVSIYHAALYLLRRNDPGALHLAILSCAIAVRTLIMGDHALSWVLPGLPWSWQLKAEYVSGYVAVLAGALILRTNFPAETPKLLVRATVWFAAAGSAISLFAPSRVSSRVIPGAILAEIVFVGCFALIMVTALLRKRRGSALLAAGGLTLVFTVLVDFLYYNRILGSINLTPLGLLALLLCQAFVLSREFAEVFRRQSELLRDLQSSRHLVERLHERQRRQVAEFLHGRVQGRLTMAQYKLENALRKLRGQAHPESTLLEEVLREVEDVREQDIRRASHLLHPSIIASGLVPAVRALAAQHDGELEITVRVDPALADLDLRAALDPEEAGRFPESIRICAYRIAEEALSNVLKHAAARRVTIDVGLAESGALRMVIADDGKGFDPASAASSGHYGLRMMKDRSDMMNWQFRVTRVGNETRVTVRKELR